ncbi:HD domain-containing protein [bacterium]|nr:HD domain-containing protein [bacterium]
MFSRTLTTEERQVLKKIEVFVKEKHAPMDCHDYSHVLQVAEFTIEIANNIEEEVDPMVVICGALLHDIGRTISDEMHGLIGGSMAEELLESLPLSHEQINRITRVIVRHTPGSHVPPESVEEKIVYDADGLDRLGAMGLVRGFMGKKGGMVEILEMYMSKRLKDYDELFFPISSEIGKELDTEMRKLISLFTQRLNERKQRVEELTLP